MSLRFGYGTNGFANHRLGDALAVIADLGYTGVALTLDHAHLDPYAPDLPRRVEALAAELQRRGLGVVIETGARYLLDPRRKHAPTLLDDEAAVRVEFLRRAVDIAADLGAEAVSFWAGVPGATGADHWDRLVRGCAQVVEHAESKGVLLGFEPEPGMLVETIEQWFDLRGRLGEPEPFQLTLDIGHCRAIEPHGVAECVRIAGPHLVNVQIDDMCRGVHEHLEFGAGEIDFPPVLAALREVGYTGLVAVELPRHSHAAPAVAARSLSFLQAAQWLGDAEESLAAEPEQISKIFPSVRRKLGRDAADAGRVRLLRSLPEPAAHVAKLYRDGDNDEKRAVLLALPVVDPAGEHADLLRDALRSNDSRLVAAALGPYAEHLGDDEWRHGVLKSVFMGLSLAGVHGLDARADAELARMLAALRTEREAAGRAFPQDACDLLERLT
ncbi:sugar phosphate isomerase/epimerase [Allocatelliglobosispora scoriae]|uniref:Sugar phosphate isomerase/epimerase n=1 Tax=Allocatelliglobosispora scoriae TaxID=643052 RepID=A0A841BP82_9ACTN|nr:EboA domain-containing protein [Allocatelliglobosispora scoriae]MBB5869116.1 sugar phosphate isomerase/epimerase [Allocatelliglobosispora scoriae]